MVDKEVVEADMIDDCEVEGDAEPGLSFEDSTDDREVRVLPPSENSEDIVVVDAMGGVGVGEAATGLQACGLALRMM